MYFRRKALGELYLRHSKDRTSLIKLSLGEVVTGFTNQTESLDNMEVVHVTN